VRRTLVQKELSFDIVSHKDRDDLYAELWGGDEQWGEIRLDRDGREVLKIHPPRSGAGYEFELSSVTQLLERARKHLLEIEGIEE
jgi:hypothetical protein